MQGCIACELASGRAELPGGRIAETGRWLVEHCVGPLGVGTLIVKPRRHITHVWELDDAEAAELGPLLRRVSSALERLLSPDQVYVSLWSHAGGQPAHIHWVVQPVAAVEPGAPVGPHLQSAMFHAGELPARTQVEEVCERLRKLLA